MKHLPTGQTRYARSGDCGRLLEIGTYLGSTRATAGAAILSELVQLFDQHSVVGLITPSETGLLLLAIVAGYLAGSIPFAYLAAKSVGVDILTVGTRNPGAANVFRAVDKRLGALVFLADAGKGAIAVVIALLIGVPDELAAIGGGAAIVGHMRPILPRLGGGAGLAAATGAVVAVAWIPGVAGLVVGGLALAILRSSGHAAAAGLLTIAIVGFAVQNEWVATSSAMGLAGLMFARHVVITVNAKLNKPDEEDAAASG
jgi:glycerol-3-phosphate acyltransferase PlsY